MEVNWTILSYVVIGYMALVGLSRGWWKEAVTGVFLAILIFFLQNPDWARTVIESINEGIAAVWSYIPTGITSVIDDGLTNFFAVTTRSDTPFAIDPNAPQTWFTMLIIALVVAVLFSRLSFGNAPPPTGLGRLLGAVMGGINGWLILGIAREYLDGRALPGQAASAEVSEIQLVGSSSFGPPNQSLSLNITGLPDVTVLDSVLPWIAIGAGLLFFVTLFKTRYRIAKNEDGRKLETRLPPFYRTPKKAKKPEKPEDVIKKMFA